MGYELHIVRQNDWNDVEEASNISLEEWIKYAKTDKEILLTNDSTSDPKSRSLSTDEGPGFVYWIGHPTLKNTDKPWFDYWRGSISTKYPDDATIKKMIQIAFALNARVQGDDLEYYDDSFFTNGGRPVSNDANAKIENPIDNSVNILKKPWWKFW